MLASPTRIVVNPDGPNCRPEYRNYALEFFVFGAVEETVYDSHSQAYPRSLKEIGAAIPAEFFARDTRRGLLYLARDLLLATIARSLAAHIDPLFKQLSTRATLSLIGAEVSRSGVYWWLQGLIFTGIWVTRDEVILGSRHTTQVLIMRGFGDTGIYTVCMSIRQQVLAFPPYLFFDVSDQRTRPKWTNHFDRCRHHNAVISNLGIAAIYAGSIWSVSERNLYVMTVVMITYLHHTDPVIPHNRGTEWSIQQSAAATVGQPILEWQEWFFLPAFFHFIHRAIRHHISYTKILFTSSRLVPSPQMPFYHGPEATQHLKAFIGDL
ncbi:hypothetical protein BD779DRAFT_1677381 [Infundibulicybe gibba]|nr:hypothetical protein BD779DRAFT_1677381 [Infundibulicybe gibba]